MTITIDHDDLCTLLAGLNAMIHTIYDPGVDAPEELEADYHGDRLTQEEHERPNVWRCGIGVTCNVELDAGMPDELRERVQAAIARRLAKIATEEIRRANDAAPEQ